MGAFEKELKETEVFCVIQIENSFILLIVCVCENAQQENKDIITNFFLSVTYLHTFSEYENRLIIKDTLRHYLLII